MSVWACEANGFVFAVSTIYMLACDDRTVKFAKRKVYYFMMQYIYNILITGRIYGKVRFTHVERLT